MSLKEKLQGIKNIDHTTDLYSHLSNVLTKILLDNPKVSSIYIIRMRMNCLKIIPTKFVRVDLIFKNIKSLIFHHDLM